MTTNIAHRLRMALASGETPDVTARLAALYNHSTETADTDDAFNSINSSFLSVLEQAFKPIYFFSTMLRTQGGREGGFAVYGSPAEHGDAIWANVSKTNYLTDINLSNGAVYLTFDPTLRAPFDFSVAKDRLDKAETFLKPLGIKLGPDEWVHQEVKMTLAQYKKLSFDGLTPEVDAEGGGFPDPIVDETLEQLMKDAGLGFEYTLIFDRKGPPLNNFGYYRQGSLRILATVAVPEDFFYWLDGTHDTTAPRLKKFPFSLAQDFGRLACKGYGNGIAWPPVITTPRMIKERLDQYTTAFKGFQPRINARGWCITPNGGLFKPEGLVNKQPQRHGELYIERGEKIDALFVQRNTLSRKEDKTAEDITAMANIDREIKEVEQSYQGRVAVVDWINDKMVRINEDGGDTLEDLTGTRALDPVTEASFLNMRIGNRRMQTMLRNTLAKVGGYVRDAYDDDPANWQGYDTTTNTYKTAANPRPRNVGDDISLLLTYPDVEFKHLLGIDIENNFEGTNNAEQKIRACRNIADTLRSLKPKIGEIMAETSEFNQTTMMGWILETLSNTTEDDYRAINAVAQQEVRKSTVKADMANFSVPNVMIRPGKFEALMPHQADVLSVLVNGPNVALEDISAGGGKTTIGIIDIIKGLEAGRFKRPLVTTAGNLVPGFISEINTLTNGKINAVPLRVDQVADAIERLDMKEINDFVRWVQSFPINTIFVNAYTDYTNRRIFFDSFDAPVAYGTILEAHCQFRQIMGACGFDYMMVDESQFIKNKDSSRTKGATHMLSRAAYRRPASGTMLNNNVLDLYGQVSASVNGAVFGAQDEFEGRYSIDKGLIQEASKAQLLRNDLRQHAAMLTKRKQDWAFLLPDLDPEFIYCRLTPLQTTYYNRMMTEAEMEIRREIERIKEKNGSLSEEELEARIQSMLETRLQAIEQFLVAPDLNKDYSHPEQGGGENDLGLPPLPVPKGVDLASPEVLAADIAIDKHIASGDTGKIIVFGYHKAASAHFMKHTRHADKCIRYTAGDLDAIAAFKDPRSQFTILVADENSMKQGHNLQIASHIIRLQAVWAPGDYEQAISRMFRPDPRGVFNRQTVKHSWILPLDDKGGATLAVAKAARMISKAISNARVSNADDMAWRRIENNFEELELIKMNPALIFGGFTLDDAQRYFGGWERLGNYEATQMKAVRKQYGEKLEAQHNMKLMDDQGRVINMAEFAKLVMVPVVQAPDIPGSRAVHVPWIENADPADPHGLNLELVRDTVLTEGQFVVTEFGPGQVKSVRLDRSGAASSAKVQTAVGILNIATNTLAVPTTPAGADALAKQWGNLARYALVPPGMKVDPRLMSPLAGRKPADDETKPGGVKIKAPGKPGEVPGQTPPTDVPDNKTTEDDTKPSGLSEIDIQAGVINGMPILFTRDDEVDFLRDINTDWQKVDEFVAVEFNTWKGVEGFLTALDNNFWIDVPVMAKLRAGMEDMKRGRTVRADMIPNPGLIKNFFTESHRKLGVKEGWPRVKPYWMTRGTEVRMVFSVGAHTNDLFSWLNTEGKTVSGVKKISRNPGMWVNFFKTAKEAAEDAKGLVVLLKKRGITVDIPTLNTQLVEASKIIAQLRRGGE